MTATNPPARSCPPTDPHAAAELVKTLAAWRDSRKPAPPVEPGLFGDADIDDDL